jgi:hypothetical protein
MMPRLALKSKKTTQTVLIKTVAYFQILDKPGKQPVNSRTKRKKNRQKNIFAGFEICSGWPELHLSSAVI